MADDEKAGGEVRKLSRLEREQEKVRIAQKNIDEILATQKKNHKKQDTRDKILLGVMLRGMIADGAISTELFENALEKYLNPHSALQVLRQKLLAITVLKLHSRRLYYY